MMMCLLLGEEAILPLCYCINYMPFVSKIIF
jgi:hypothetical protein